MPGQTSWVPSDELVALWRRVEPRLRALGDALGDALTDQQHRWYEEFIQANEFGVALEMLADWLSEDERPLRDEDRAEMLSLAREMGNEGRIASALILCPPES
jgi:hypothetical protein